MSLRGRLRRLSPPRRVVASARPGSGPDRERGRTPPAIPDGWQTGPPDYIGIGVQKAGTTRWWKLIVAHPDVVGDGLKETHYVSQLGRRAVSASDREGYYRFFPRPDGSQAGEWTPRYMSLSGLSEVMYALAPEARLLVMLRDPVERYRSGVGHWQKLRQQRGLPPNLRAGRRDAYQRSFYAAALRPYIEAYGRDRLLVLQFEKSLLDPVGEYRRTTQFLGLDDWRPPDELLGERFNPSRPQPSPAELDEPADLVEAIEPDVRELLAIAPEIEPSLWPNFRHLATVG